MEIVPKSFNVCDLNDHIAALKGMSCGRWKGGRIVLRTAFCRSKCNGSAIERGLAPNGIAIFDFLKFAAAMVTTKAIVCSR